MTKFKESLIFIIAGSEFYQDEAKRIFKYLIKNNKPIPIVTVIGEISRKVYDIQTLDNYFND